MSDVEIERVYGRCRKKHIMADYATHLQVYMRDVHCTVSNFHAEHSMNIGLQVEDSSNICY